MLIALSIAAALLTATAVALDASIKSYQVNQEHSTLAQRARLAMHRILATIRAGDLHMPHDDTAEDDFRSGLVVQDTGIDLETDDGAALTYRYDATNKQLLADVGGGVTHVVLDGVEAFTLTLEPMRSAAHIKAGLDYDLLRRATIILSIRSTDETALPGEIRGQQTLTMSSSAMPRRNSW
jgi:hypothetical protein